MRLCFCCVHGFRSASAAVHPNLRAWAAAVAAVVAAARRGAREPQSRTGTARAATRWYLVPSLSASGAARPSRAGGTAAVGDTAAAAGTAAAGMAEGDTAAAVDMEVVVAATAAAVLQGAATAADVSVVCWSLK